LTQAFQFLRVDAFLFKDVQDEQLTGILEKAPQQVLNLEALGFRSRIRIMVSTEL
jgi:hypothetical protein